MRKGSANELGSRLCAAQLVATERGDVARAARAGELIEQLVAALRTLHAARERVGLNWVDDKSTHSGLRAWRTMADDHNSPNAWRAAERAFRDLGRVHRAVEQSLADELGDLLEDEEDEDSNEDA